MLGRAGTRAVPWLFNKNDTAREQRPQMAKVHKVYPRPHRRAGVIPSVPHRGMLPWLIVPIHERSYARSRHVIDGDRHFARGGNREGDRRRWVEGVRDIRAEFECQRSWVIVHSRNGSGTGRGTFVPGEIKGRHAIEHAPAIVRGIIPRGLRG
jgi:hypothetical protein